MAPEPEVSSPHSPQPDNGPYTEPSESIQQPAANLLNVHFDPILPSTSWSSNWLFPSGFPTNLCTRFSPVPCLWSNNSINHYKSNNYNKNLWSPNVSLNITVSSKRLNKFKMEEVCPADWKDAQIVQFRKGMVNQVTW
jgi:hypothetical protein